MPGTALQAEFPAAEQPAFRLQISSLPGTAIAPESQVCFSLGRNQGASASSCHPEPATALEDSPRAQAAGARHESRLSS